ncbi:Protein of unknown function, partial [Gryllus bimaculatus]
MARCVVRLLQTTAVLWAYLTASRSYAKLVLAPDHPHSMPVALSGVSSPAAKV